MRVLAGVSMLFVCRPSLAAEPMRVAVLRADGARAEVGPVEDALRGSRELRVVGPIDRPAPRTSHEVQALGESLDVGLVVVLSDRAGGAVLRVFEVRRGAYFEGTLESPLGADAVRDFVERRAVAAGHARSPSEHEVSSDLRLWAGLGVAVVAAGAFAAIIAFGGSDDAPDSVRLDVVR